MKICPHPASIPLEIIAEGGLNHDGDLQRAIALADAAKHAGADVFKIQTSVPSLEATRGAPCPPYLKAAGFHDQLALIQQIMLTRRDTLALAAHCQEIGIEFMSTPGDTDSLKFLVEEAGVRRIKIASCDIDNAPLLLAAGSTGLPLILSTGASTVQEISDALNVLPVRLDVTLLQCVSAYPCKLDDANVAGMATLSQIFRKPVGYSDHTIGGCAAAAAVAIGANMIEKHVTYDQNAIGPDHAMSMPVTTFPDFVRFLRGVRRSLGWQEKAPLECEVENKPTVRKSIVAARAIHKGEPFTAENITVKRPSGGRPPFDYWNVLQRTAERDYAEDEMID